MSQSTVAFADRIFPPGSLEWQQQERLRRINRITQERENQRLQGLFLRELRLQRQPPEFGLRRVMLNNNTQISSPSVAITRTTSAKSPTPTTSTTTTTNRLKKSKSSSAKVKVQSKVKVPSKARKAVKNLHGLVRKVSMPTASSLAKSRSKVIPVIPIRSSIMRVQLREVTSKAGSGKVSFSMSNKKKTSKDIDSPAVTTPVSILKKREKIENLVKSSLVLSSSPEDLRANQNAEKSVAGEGANEIRISFKPVPPPNPPPQPNIGICKAFPATKEWEEYWSNFSKVMDKYNDEMREYERRAAETFKDDLVRYSEQTQKLGREREIYKNGGTKRVELGVIPPPPIMSKELNGLQLFNGYIIKSKGMKGQVSNLPGTPTGIRFEVDVKGEEPNKVHIQKDHNLLTVTLENGRFLRIGTPSGKLAGEMQVWPPIDGIIIIDAP